MFTKIIAFSIALIPFFCWLGWDEGIRTPKETASVISLAIIIVAGFLSFPIKKAFNRYFFLFLGWCVVTLFLSDYAMPIYLKDGVLSLPSTMIAFKSLFYIALAILTIQVIYSSDINLKLIAKTISIVCFVMSAYCIVQLVGLDEWFRVADPNTGWVGKTIWDNCDPNQWGHYSRRIVGTVGNPSILAIFLSLCLPFSLYLRSKLGYISAGLSLIIIALTLSLTAYISTALIVIFILFFFKRRIAIGLIALCILSGIFISSNPSTKFMLNPTGRIAVLKESFLMLSKKAITGYGLGSFQYLIGLNPEVAKKLNNENWKELHNEYGQVWFETGIIGLILMLMGIGSVMWRFIKNIQEDTVYLMASFMGFLLVCLTYFPLRVSPLSLYGVIILGLLTNKIGDVKC